MTSSKSTNSPCTGADDHLKPGRPKYQSVKPEYDEEIAGTKVRDKERNDTETNAADDDSNETSGGRRPGKKKRN